MTRYGVAAVGAIWLIVLGGCTQSDLTAGSAMARLDDLRAQASDVRVSVELREILTP